MNVKARKKLIEVALPLEAINVACKAEKNRKTGTIRNLHKWFAPMPLPAWRALLFAALVDDPGSDNERDQMMRLIERLVANGGALPDEATLAAARREIERCWPDGPPIVADLFCGGGSTLVEAQRLGCSTFGSDLNPVPVLITKVLTELLPTAAGHPALHPPGDALPVAGGTYDGVIADVLHYADQVKLLAHGAVGDLYSRSGPLTTVAWLWARTGRCPNPACGIETPLVTSWVLSKKEGDERWITPAVVDGKVVFQVAGPSGNPTEAAKTGRGASFKCIACGALLVEDYLRAEGEAGRLGLRLIAAIDSSADDSRIYRAPTAQEEAFALGVTTPDDAPSLPLPDNPRWFSPPLFGFKTHADLYTNRQLRLLSAFATAVRAVPDQVQADGGTAEYARLVAAILGLCVGKLAQYSSTQALIGPTKQGTWFQSGFTRSDIPMNWDFCELNPFADAGPSWSQIVSTALRAIPFAPEGTGRAFQGDARSVSSTLEGPVLFAIDPPYFDQIGYADLSDYFYPWLRIALRETLPELFATVAAPKEGELVALPVRHGGDRAAARKYFIDGFVETLTALSSRQVETAPILLVYAFKEQNARVGSEEIAPGWEAILEATIQAGLTIVGTLPIHGTGSTRMIGLGTNALATYVVLVCRPRPPSAGRISRSELMRELHVELATAVQAFQRANIAPVDLAQAVIGPGMEVYTRHASVIEPDGSRVAVAEALAIINGILGRILEDQEGDFDADTRWAIAWFEQYGFAEGQFGVAETLSKAKNTSVSGAVAAGIVESGHGRVRLLRPDELPSDWDPTRDQRLTVWEATHHLVRALGEGEQSAASLLGRLGSVADAARDLAYRLYGMCDRKKRASEALAYNGLVQSWPEILRLAAEGPASQTTMEI